MPGKAVSLFPGHQRSLRNRRVIQRKTSGNQLTCVSLTPLSLLFRDWLRGRETLVSMATSIFLLRALRD